jgi:hypothetical protein
MEIWHTITRDWSLLIFPNNVTGKLRHHLVLSREAEGEELEGICRFVTGSAQ